MLEEWMRSYKPEELFDENGKLHAGICGAGADRAIAAWARIRTPTAGCCCRICRCRISAIMRVDGAETRAADGRSDAGDGQVSARRDEAECRIAKFPRVRSGRNSLQPAGRGVRSHRQRSVERILPTDEHLSPTGA